MVGDSMMRGMGGWGIVVAGLSCASLRLNSSSFADRRVMAQTGAPDAGQIALA